MLKTVKLYGDLADFVGWKEQKAEVRNTVEVMRFLRCNHPELETYMIDKFYKVDIGGYYVTEENMLDPIAEEIKIIPVVEGKIFGIFTGIGLLFAGSALSAAKFVGAGILASIAFNLGASLIIQDINRYLTPKPKPMSSLEPEDATVNFAFSGVTNVSRAGVALPLVYGDIFVGSINVSNGIDTDQIEGSV
tara:strand:+ start:343 stop:915 length:573 start_codon:yes stop_codon:yes gene_type:complete